MDASDITIGFELEYGGFDASEDINFLWDTFSPYGEVVEEGSLDYGFEIVSPVYLGDDFFTSKVDSSIKDLFRVISRLRGLEIGDNTGLHFHVGREGLEEHNLQWIYEFCYSQAGLSILSSVGGRGFNSFCQVDKPDWESITLKDFCSRNTIVNPWGLGGKTIEFRSPLSTTKLPNFLAKAQLIVAIVQASDDIPNGICSNFLDFVAEKEYNFAELSSLLKVVYESH